MNVAGEKAQVGAQINVVNPNVYNTCIKNYVTVLQGTQENFNEQINCIRAKWKDIEATEDATDETTVLVEKVTDNAEEIAKKLKSMREALKQKVVYMNELLNEVVALRADCSDVLTVSKWADCEEEYMQAEERIEERRIEKLQQERKELEMGLSIVRAQYKTALSDLCEADEKLQRLKMVVEELEDTKSSEISAWQETVRIKDSTKKRSPEDIKILKKNIQELRKKIERMEKRRRSEKEEYRTLQQQCLDAVDRMKELNSAIINRDVVALGIQCNLDQETTTESENSQPLSIEDISTSVITC
ncbi:hypothetical protein LOTGIDRAFT_234878 [Lottia gigantea]|uniref:Uncharacterized protein n=1 Tax=Lottia gigantea TaxID=225164 RepID=V4A3U3_LOTGI|nr:hypothetical protein LOTGIDRAFT_234878 [Lottia gigantea]ESO87891.1 hypothetical protein LOTGIDRAFT_234878 [Lottia gigantea]